MAERNVTVGFPGISMNETRTSYKGNAKFVPAWLIEMFFELGSYGPEQQEKLRKSVERRLVRLDLSWSFKEHLKPEEAGAKCAPLTKDIIRVATEREISREEARQALLEEGDYELANLPEELVDLIDQGRMDVVIFGQDRHARMNAKYADLRFRSFDLLSLLRIFQSNRIDIASIKRYERKSDPRRAKVKGPAGLVLRTGPFMDESFLYITYVELPTAEKPGIILVLPMCVIWHLGSIAIGDLAWTYKRFTDAVDAVDVFFDRVKPTKTEATSDQKVTEEAAGSEEEAEPGDEDDGTPDPDVDMSDGGNQETSATAN